MDASMMVDARGARPGYASDAVEAQVGQEGREAGWWTPG